MVLLRSLCFSIVIAAVAAACQAQAPILQLDFEADHPDLQFHNGAAVIETDEGRAISLDAVQEQYASIEAAVNFAALGGIRLEARIRLARPEGGQVPIGRPGSCMIYVDGQSRPWGMVWTDEGRKAYVSDQPLETQKWHHIVFNYADDGYAALLADGEVVAMGRATGPLTDTGRDWEMGRYEWAEEGETTYAFITGEIDDVVVSAPKEDFELPDISKVKVCRRYSWGDIIMAGRDDSKDKVRATLDAANNDGVNTVIWRVAAAYLREYYEFLPKEELVDSHIQYQERVAAVFDEFDPIAYAIELCHDLGMECCGWITIWDEGAPGEMVQYADAVPFPWQSTFTKEHPYTCVVDRDGEPQWGVMEYAYPEARQYKVNMIVDYMTRYDFDGVFISTRSHSNPAMDGTRFGFNEPVVKEFQERYGVDILESEDFDREAWRKLRGEQVTKLLRELREAMPEGKRVSIGIPRGDHWGPPYGNLFTDWRTWVEDGLIDELVVGELTGKGLYPERKDYTGYIFDQEAGVGVRPLSDDIREVFGPLCKKHGVEVYLRHSDPSTALPYLGDGLTGVCM